MFRSAEPELDALSGASNNGHFEYYRYDDRDGQYKLLDVNPRTVSRWTDEGLQSFRHDGRPSALPLVGREAMAQPSRRREVLPWS